MVAGLSFHRLFKVCREKFLVSSEMTLRSHLTEFKDHQLIQIRYGVYRQAAFQYHSQSCQQGSASYQLVILYVYRRAPDGTDAIYIPFPADTLTTILADMEVAE